MHPVRHRCNFCGRRQERLRQLIAGDHAYICSDCVITCCALIAAQDNDAFIQQLLDQLEAAINARPSASIADSPAAQVVSEPDERPTI